MFSSPNVAFPIDFVNSECLSYWWLLAISCYPLKQKPLLGILGCATEQEARIAYDNNVFQTPFGDLGLRNGGESVGFVRQHKSFKPLSGI